ncbi:MAG: GDSL-type esterase/lipase family protein [Kiritimatiellia bacterium]
MKTFLCSFMIAACLLLGLVTTTAHAAATPPAGTAQAAPIIAKKGEAQWHGYQRINFTFDGRSAWVTVPKAVAPGAPWMWRARWPGYHDEIDVKLLEAGYHTVYVDTPDMYGSPRAMAVWDRFYQYLISTYHFSAKTVLYGCSRGGFFIYNFANRWPERVAVIYGDTPTMDFKSWPQGKDGMSVGSAGDWKQLIAQYGFASEAEADASTDIPLNYAERIAAHHIPIWHTIGPEDRVVPPKYNSEPFAARYRAAGGEITLHYNKGPYQLQGHHFPLDAVNESVQFIIQNTPLPDLPASLMATWSKNAVNLRPALERILAKKQARVIFLGGSITYNPGWQNMTMDSLRRRFPQVQFEFRNIGVPSLGSLSHVFRWREHFAGPADLVFFESVVNDLHNSQTPEEIERAYEGVLRGIQIENPNVGLICLHFAEPRYTAAYAQGQLHPIVATHTRIASHYALPQLNLAKEVADRLAAKQFDWERDFRDLHPSPFGQRLYYSAISKLFNEALAAAQQSVATVKLPAAIRKDAWTYGNFIPGAKAYNLNRAKPVSAWKPLRPMETRAMFVNCPMLVAEGEGASFSMDFTGSIMGVYIVASPESAVLEYSVDGAKWNSVDTFTRWSSYICMPWPFILEKNLSEGKHTVQFRVKANGKRNLVNFYALCVAPIK